MRITRTTFKSFLNKNKDKLLISNLSNFDGMVDCVMPTENKSFRPTESGTGSTDHTFGIKGVWLVGHGGDRFYDYKDGKRQGIEVYNCCGNFVVAVEV